MVFLLMRGEEWRRAVDRRSLALPVISSYILFLYLRSEESHRIRLQIALRFQTGSCRHPSLAWFSRGTKRVSVESSGFIASDRLVDTCHLVLASTRLDSTQETRTRPRLIRPFELTRVFLSRG